MPQFPHLKNGDGINPCKAKRDGRVEWEEKDGGSGDPGEVQMKSDPMGSPQGHKVEPP